MAKVEIEGLPEDYSVEDDEDFVYLKKKGEEKPVGVFSALRATVDSIKESAIRNSQKRPKRN